MKKQILLTLAAAFALPSVLMLAALGQAAQEPKDVDLPAVFQAAGPNATRFRARWSRTAPFRVEPNNVNNPGPLQSGRREINWDGGGPPVDTYYSSVTPFNVFLDTRGGQFTTPGAGLSQAPPSGGPTGRACRIFNNPTYGTTFTAFSPLRLFTPVGSNTRKVCSSCPASMGKFPATVRGFGAVFTDVDEPNGVGPNKKRGNPRGASTRIEYFDDEDKLVFSSFVPASPGDGSYRSSVSCLRMLASRESESQPAVPPPDRR